MDVQFVSKHKGSTVIQCPDLGPRHVIRFNRGKKKTSNKAEIRRLLSDSYCQRYVELAPGQDMEAISEYLLSDATPDIMTRAYLQSIPFNAWKDIIEVRNDVKTRFPNVGVAIATLEGQPIDSRIEEIVANFDDSEEVETLSDDTEAPPPDSEEEPEPTEASGDKPKLKVKSTSGKKNSRDFNVAGAVKYMERREHEDLEDFIHPDEDRVGVIREWNARFPDHEIPVPESK
jgi:hypothetical protein